MPENGIQSAASKSKSKPELRERLKEVLRHTSAEDIAVRICRKISANNIRSFAAGNTQPSHGEERMLDEVLRDIESDR